MDLHLEWFWELVAFLDALCVLYIPVYVVATCYKSSSYSYTIYNPRAVLTWFLNRYNGVEELVERRCTEQVPTQMSATERNEDETTVVVCGSA